MPLKKENKMNIVELERNLIKSFFDQIDIKRWLNKEPLWLDFEIDKSLIKEVISICKKNQFAYCILEKSPFNMGYKEYIDDGYYIANIQVPLSFYLDQKEEF